MEKKTTFTLPNRIVNVVPIIRQNSWLPRDHDGQFMFTGTAMRLTVPNNAQTGQMVNPLTAEEQAGLEKILAKNEGDLSIYKPRKENFWSLYEVVVNKDGLTLNLSDPDQYIQYKVLMANKELVADSFENRHSVPSAKWMLVDQDFQIKSEAKEADLMQSVWMEFGAIKNDDNKLRNVLKIYSNKQVPKNAKRDFLITEVKKVIEENPNRFIEVITDEYFTMRCFVEDAIEVGAIVKTGRNKYALAGEPDDVYTIKQIMEELNPEGTNQDMYFKIKTQIDESK